jgi:protein gp37
MKTTDYFTAAEHWNLAHGCSKVSAGCKHCWAERMAVRHRNASTRGGKWSGNVVTFPKRLEQPLHWRKPRVVAVQFMGDVFHDDMTDDFLDSVFGVMWACRYLGAEAYPGHTFLLLTKRPGRGAEYMRQDRRRKHAQAAVRYGGGIDPDALYDSIAFATAPHPRIWVGISAEDQETLDARWPMLAEVPAAKHWISVEPMLGSVELKCHGCGQDVQSHRAPDQGGCSGWFPDLVVAGGESGPGARPCDIGWMRSLRRQCGDAGVPFHLKQLGAVPVTIGEPTGNFRTHNGRRQMEIVADRYPITDSKGANPDEWPPDLRVREWPS